MLRLAYNVLLELVLRFSCTCLQLDSSIACCAQAKQPFAHSSVNAYNVDELTYAFERSNRESYFSVATLKEP